MPDISKWFVNDRGISKQGADPTTTTPGIHFRHEDIESVVIQQASSRDEWIWRGLLFILCIPIITDLNRIDWDIGRYIDALFELLNGSDGLSMLFYLGLIGASIYGSLERPTLFVIQNGERFALGSTMNRERLGLFKVEYERSRDAWKA